MPIIKFFIYVNILLENVNLILGINLVWGKI